jgi:hypothetical protein
MHRGERESRANIGGHVAALSIAAAAVAATAAVSRAETPLDCST